LYESGAEYAGMYGAVMCKQFYNSESIAKEGTGTDISQIREKGEN
jgi:hypothetical protein